MITIMIIGNFCIALFSGVHKLTALYISSIFFIYFLVKCEREKNEGNMFRYRQLALPDSKTQRFWLLVG